MRHALLVAMLIALPLLDGCGGGGNGAGGAPGNDASTATLGASPLRVGADGDTAACAGADLSALQKVVYVAPPPDNAVGSGNSGGNCGESPGTACSSLQQGIANCTASSCGVLVRHGLYEMTSSVELRDGVSVYGSCRFDGEPDRKYRSVLSVGPLGGQPAISASGIATPTVLQGLVVVSQDETVPGAASIAMKVEASKGLSLRGNVFSAGRGGDGAAGQSGPVSKGGDGSPGLQISGGQHGAGGKACPAANSPTNAGDGGDGGDGSQAFGTCFLGSCSCGESNSDRIAGRDGQGVGDIPGSKGGSRAYGGSFCVGSASDDDFKGHGGFDGKPGRCGDIAGLRSDDVWGAIDASAWAAGAGGFGSDGGFGSGGGGGSSGGYCVDGFSQKYLDSFPGGGAGGGGCGAYHAPGGQQGGASIALLLLSDSVVEGLAEHNLLIPGPGGNGGRGADGAAGGLGGRGGPGAKEGDKKYGSYTCPAASGSGGNGGQGGAGAAGAGGNGGPAIAVALRNAPRPASGAGLYLGAPGGPGAGASGGVNPNCKGADSGSGIGGGSVQIYDFAKSSQPVLASGERLRRGQKKVSSNGQTILQFQGAFLCTRSWCANNSGFGSVDYVEMQSDGNFCGRYDDGSSGGYCIDSTAGHPGAYLLVRDDGKLAIYDGSIALVTFP